MAQVHLYVPEELQERILELPDETNLSAIFQRAIAAELSTQGQCAHPAGRCTSCGALLELGDAGANGHRKPG